jgi:hypothetical protein
MLNDKTLISINDYIRWPVVGLPAGENEKLGTIGVLSVVGHGHGTHTKMFNLGQLKDSKN